MLLITFGVVLEPVNFGKDDSLMCASARAAGLIYLPVRRSLRVIRVAVPSPAALRARVTVLGPGIATFGVVERKRGAKTC